MYLKSIFVSPQTDYPCQARDSLRQGLQVSATPPREYHYHPLAPPRHQSIFITSHPQEIVSHQMRDHLSLFIAFPF